MAPLVIAHRGASAYKLENTIGAFRLAADMGADGVELDVHATKDGVIVVHHNADVRGTSVASSTWAELADKRLANDDPVPRLEDALDAVRGIAYVEVKGLAEEYDEALFAAIDRAGGATGCHVHSFDHRIIRRLSARRPELIYGILRVSIPVRHEGQWTDAGASELWQARDFTDETVVAAAHAGGAKVYVWTVDDADDAKRLAALDVDGICTNRPDIIKEALNS